MTVAEQTTTGLDEVFVEALMLPQSERLVLARQLIDSCTADEPTVLNRQQLGELLNARIKAGRRGANGDFGRFRVNRSCSKVARGRAVGSKRRLKRVGFRRSPYVDYRCLGACECAS